MAATYYSTVCPFQARQLQSLLMHACGLHNSGFLPVLGTTYVPRQNTLLARCGLGSSDVDARSADLACAGVGLHTSSRVAFAPFPPRVCEATTKGTFTLRKKHSRLHLVGTSGPIGAENWSSLSLLFPWHALSQPLHLAGLASYS